MNIRDGLRIAHDCGPIDERLALFAVGLLKSRVIEDLQRAKAEAAVAGERRQHRRSARHRAASA